MSLSVLKLLAEPVSSDSEISSSVLLTASANDLQSHLTAFVQSALQQSRSGILPMEASLELLDQAWAVQKLVWQMRSHLSPKEIDRDRGVRQS